MAGKFSRLGVVAKVHYACRKNSFNISNALTQKFVKLMLLKRRVTAQRKTDERTRT
jgi:hypothetical protein